MGELPYLLTVEQLAPLLRLTEHGVRAMLRRGEIPASRLGRKWIVRREALEAHLARAERRLRARAPDAEDAAARVLRSLPGARR